jgi:predicted  nucleic acid-binding Zn-ribbon protein
MNRESAVLPQDEDLDRTDKLPVLDLEAADCAQQDDPLESTGTWVQVEVETAGLRQEIEQRDAAIAELTTLLRQKSFALSRAEKDVDQARAELMRTSQAAGRGTADLERRLQELEREYVNISALHDERRVAIAGLEDALSDAREREHQLEARVAELSARQQASAAAHEQGLARLADTEHRLAQATRESLGAAGRQDQQRLEERVEALQLEADTAREEAAAAKEALARLDGQAGELKASLAERNARIESLLEKLRSREARRRYAADIRRAAAPAADLGALQQRIVELQAELAMAREPGREAGDALAGPDDPTIAGNDRQGLLLRISELSADIDRRDARIAKLESELQAIGRPPETAATGVTVQPGDETLPVRYLVRLDDGVEVVHELSGQRMSIGRTPDNDLQIRENHISRVHAFLRLGPGSAILEDAASRNGVFVNDRRIRRELLKDGDVVTFGKSRFRFQLTRPGDR